MTSGLLAISKRSFSLNWLKRERESGRGRGGREEEGQRRRKRRESRLIFGNGKVRVQVQLDPESPWDQGCLCPSLGSVSAGLSFSGLLTALMGENILQTPPGTPRPCNRVFLS